MDTAKMIEIEAQIASAWKTLAAGPAGYLRFVEARDAILSTAGVALGDWCSWTESR